MKTVQPLAEQLELLWEAKIRDVLGDQLDPRLEASGVLAKDGDFYIIFDDLPGIACVGAGLSGAQRHRIIEQDRGHRRGFEDIAYDRRSDRFYVLIESLPRGPGCFMAKVQEYDGSFRYLSAAWLDFPLDRPNKGLEGLTCVHRNGRSYLLGLCEGNKCEGGAKGRIPGGGRIQVFHRGPRHWEHVARIRLPETLLFEDYSGISVDGDRIVVVSQVSSALWTGRLTPTSWDIADEGTTHAFPRNALDEIIYGTVEGVSWIAPDQVVVVSDKAKPEQDNRVRAKDQSIHIFRIPARPGGREAPPRPRACP
jgi:hypothetical protein